MAVNRALYLWEVVINDVYKYNFVFRVTWQKPEVTNVNSNTQIIQACSLRVWL